MSGPTTRRQREVLDYLRELGALSRKTARPARLFDGKLADKLARLGVLNKRETKRADAYWIRAEDEAATGTLIERGFMVILARDITTPSGRTDNVFFVKTRYDGKGSRTLLQGWLRQLGLRRQDFLGVEPLPTDSPQFTEDNVILDEIRSQ